jgi:hypothetical protein
MHVHRGHQLRVVHLNTPDRVNHNQFSPQQVNLLVIWQERKASLNELSAAISLFDRQTITVLRGRPGADIPELRQILGREAQSNAVRSQRTKRKPYDFIVWILTL